MVKYFFDFRSGATISRDDVGEDLPDAAAAHREALDALAHAIRDVAMEGARDQHLVVEVRDDLGRVLEVSVVFRVRIFRTIKLL